MENDFFLVRGVPGRIVPHPSGKAERFLGFREAAEGESPQHTIPANPEGGHKWQAPGRGSKPVLVSQPTTPRGKAPEPVYAHIYPGRHIHLVPHWERVANTAQTRILIPKAIAAGDLQGQDVHDRELHEQGVAAQLAAGLAAQASAAALLTEAPASDGSK